MKKTLIFLLLLLSASAAQAQLCTITGTLTKGNGAAWPNAKLYITKVVKNGRITSTENIEYEANASGVVTFTAYRGSRTWLYSRATGFYERGTQGIPFMIPDAATADLDDLVPAQNIEVGITTILGNDSTRGLSITRLNFRGAGVTTVKDPDSATVHVEITAGTGTDTTSLSWRLEIVTDSLRKAYDSLAVQRTYMETVLAAISLIVSDSLELMVRTESDPVWLSEKSGYQTSLTAAQLARIDSGLAAGAFITITDAGTIQLIAVDTTGFFAAFGGVMTESDPTATAKAQVVARDTVDAASDGGPRSWSTAGRWMVKTDTLTGTAIDWSTGNTFLATLTGNTVFTFSNLPPAGYSQIVNVRIVQSSGGSNTVTFPSTVRWMGGSAPTMIATANKGAVATFIWDGIYIWGAYRDEEN